MSPHHHSSLHKFFLEGMAAGLDILYDHKRSLD